METLKAHRQVPFLRLSWIWVQLHTREITMIRRPNQRKGWGVVLSHRIHVWNIYIYLHLVDVYGFHVGKYTSPMDPLGLPYNFGAPHFAAMG